MKQRKQLLKFKRWYAALLLCVLGTGTMTWAYVEGYDTNHEVFNLTFEDADTYKSGWTFQESANGSAEASQVEYISGNHCLSVVNKSGGYRTCNYKFDNRYYNYTLEFEWNASKGNDNAQQASTLEVKSGSTVVFSVEKVNADDKTSDEAQIKKADGTVLANINLGDFNYNTTPNKLFKFIVKGNINTGLYLTVSNTNAETIIDNIAISDFVNITEITGKLGRTYVVFAFDNVKLTSITKKASAPTIKVDDATGEMTLSTTDLDIDIYYTTDGSEPTASSNKYTGVVDLPEGSYNVKAKAIPVGEPAIGNFTESDVATTSGTITKIQLTATLTYDKTSVRATTSDQATPTLVVKNGSNTFTNYEVTYTANNAALSIDPSTGVAKAAGTSSATVGVTANIKITSADAKKYKVTNPTAQIIVASAPETIETTLLPIEDGDVKTFDCFRAMEWVNIANQSDRILVENKNSNQSVSFTKENKYITTERHFLLHAASGDQIEDSGIDGLRLGGKPSSAGHYVEMYVHGSGIMKIFAWKDADRTFSIYKDNINNEIASGKHIYDSSNKNALVETDIEVNLMGYNTLFLGANGGIRIEHIEWHPFVKPYISLSNSSAELNVNADDTNINTLTTIASWFGNESQSSGTTITSPIYKFTSSNTDVAEIDETTGIINPKTSGTTTISVQLMSGIQSDVHYGSTTREFILNVTGTVKKAVTLKFEKDEIALNTTDDPKPSAPALTALDADGETVSGVVYSITNNGTGITIDSNTGALTYPSSLAQGTETVTATFAENSTHKAATATYTIKVVDMILPPTVTIVPTYGEAYELKGSLEDNTTTYAESKGYYIQKYNTEGKRNATIAYVTTSQQGVTITWKNALKSADKDINTAYDSETGMSVGGADKERTITVMLKKGNLTWKAYYTVTPVDLTATIADDKKSISFAATPADNATIYYTDDATHPTTRSAHGTSYEAIESKVVTAMTVYPASMFTNNKDFQTNYVTNDLLFDDGTFYLKKDDQPTVGSVLDVATGNNVDYSNLGKLTIKLGETGAHYSKDNGNTYTPGNTVTFGKAGQENGISSYVDAYRFRSMFAGEDPRPEVGGKMAQNNKENGGYFLTPIDGSFYRLEPTANGVVTLWVRQNGDALDGSINRRPVYVMDEDGVIMQRNTNETFTNILDINGVEAHISPYSVIGGVDGPIYEAYAADETKKNDANYKFMTSVYGDDIHPDTEVGDIIYLGDESIAQGVPLYGWEIPTRNYVRYQFPVKAGKSYYIGGNGTKIGFCAVKFTEQDGYEATDISIDHKSSTGLSSSFVEGNQYNVTLNRKFYANKWNALVLPFSVSETQMRAIFGEDVEVMFYSKMPNSNRFQLTKHFYQMIYANVPCLVRPKSEVQSPTFPNVTYVGQSIREQDLGYDYILTGSYAQTTMKQYDYYTSWDDISSCIFYQATGTTDAQLLMNATRGWITSANKTLNLAPRSMRVGLGSYTGDENGEATYIETIFNGSPMDASFESDGIRMGVYNVAGQKIADTADNLPAGIYVVNGKKVIVK